jgi:hypothetical protein
MPLVADAENARAKVYALALLLLSWGCLLSRQALIALSIGSFLMPNASHAVEIIDSSNAVEQVDSRGTSDDMEQRGRQLRRAIEERYKDLVQNHQLKYETAIDDLVLKYIPLRTPIGDAEEILRSAGFAVDPRPINPPGMRPDRYDVTASIVPFIDRFPSRTSIYVSLTPTSPQDYRAISRLSATIIVSLP